MERSRDGNGKDEVTDVDETPTMSTSQLDNLGMHGSQSSSQLRRSPPLTRESSPPVRVSSPLMTRSTPSRMREWDLDEILNAPRLKDPRKNPTDTILRETDCLPNSVLEKNSFTCPLCDESKPVMALSGHLVKCFMEWSRLMGMVPICSCYECHGNRTHPGNELGGVYIDQRTNLKRTSIHHFIPPESTPTSQIQVETDPEPQISTPARQRVLPTTPFARDPINSPVSYDKLLPDQICGQDCVLCEPGKRMTDSKIKIPLIRIGLNRRFVLCKKEHLTKNGVDLVRLVDQALKKLEVHGDVSVDGHRDTPSEGVQQERTCEGLTDGTDKKSICQKPCQGDLHIVYKGENKQDNTSYFCSASHCVHWIQNKYKAGGRAKASDLPFSTRLILLPPEKCWKLLGIPKAEIDRLIECRERTRGHIGRPYSLSATDEILSFWTHFKQYPTFVFLSFVFDCPEETLRESIDRLRSWMYDMYRPHLIIQTRFYRQHYGVYFLDRWFTFAIDGSEQRILSSIFDNLEEFFYSVKKGQPSINILLVVSLDGTILWLSRSFGGSMPDLNCWPEDHGYQNQFDPDEWGFGDSGFGGMSSDNIWVSPPEHLSKIQAHYRIIVENAIAHVKSYGVCREKLRFKTRSVEKLLRTHNQNWTIASVCANYFHNRCDPQNLREL